MSYSLNYEIEELGAIILLEVEPIYTDESFDYYDGFGDLKLFKSIVPTGFEVLSAQLCKKQRSYDIPERVWIKYINKNEIENDLREVLSCTEI